MPGEAETSECDTEWGYRTEGSREAPGARRLEGGSWRPARRWCLCLEAGPRQGFEARGLLGEGFQNAPVGEGGREMACLSAHLCGHLAQPPPRWPP